MWKAFGCWVLPVSWIGLVHKWTSDRDLVELCSQLGVVIAEKDILFMEHKVNGKSKGLVVSFPGFHPGWLIAVVSQASGDELPWQGGFFEGERLVAMQVSSYVWLYTHSFFFLENLRIVTNNPNSAFQGKKVISTLAASIMGNPFHPNNQGLSRWGLLLMTDFRARFPCPTSFKFSYP